MPVKITHITPNRTLSRETFGKLPKLVIPISSNQLKHFVFHSDVAELRIDIADIMAVQKQNMPSFASIISVLSIVFYCAGFLKVELELREQTRRLNALESGAETTSPSTDADIRITKNDRGKCVICNLKFRNCGTVKEYTHRKQLKLGEINKLRKPAAPSV